MRTDEEQIDDLKQWWKKYGGPVATGLAVGLALVLGSRAWMDYRENQRISASSEYEQLRGELAADNVDAARQRGAYLIDNYARTPYAALAAFGLAKMHVAHGDFTAALERLQWALDNAREPEVTHVARLRLARVMAAGGETAAALTLLDGAKQGEFVAAYEELRGDLYASSGDNERARAAYLRALDRLKGGPGADLVQIKLDDLGPGAQG
ncbi:MAG: tetratricopeptide repeat protein [Chromatiales bacterium]|nr:tetratricopeptide repeat protein [Chromatiales bacterium]